MILLSMDGQYRGPVSGAWPLSLGERLCDLAFVDHQGKAFSLYANHVFGWPKALFVTTDGDRDAEDLARFAAPYGFGIGGAAHPEMHPDSAGWEIEIEGARRKVEAGCEYLITQLFFDNADYFAYVERVRAAGGLRRFIRRGPERRRQPRRGTQMELGILPLVLLLFGFADGTMLFLIDNVSNPYQRMIILAIMPVIVLLWIAWKNLRAGIGSAPGAEDLGASA